MSSSLFIQTLTSLRPAAVAKIHGDTANPVRGYATFYNTYIDDLPPLLSNHGYAWMAFYDARFTVSDILGRSLIIHENRDDFTVLQASVHSNHIPHPDVLPISVPESAFHCSVRLLPSSFCSRTTLPSLLLSVHILYCQTSHRYSRMISHFCLDHRIAIFLSFYLPAG